MNIFEGIIDVVLGIVLILGLLYFGLLFVGVVSGHINPECVSFISPPPPHSDRCP